MHSERCVLPPLSSVGVSRSYQRFQTPRSPGCSGVDRTTDFIDVEAENPDLIATVVTAPASTVQSNLTKNLVAGVRASFWEGKANRLSPDHVDWVEIAAVEDATVKPHTAALPLCNLVASSKTA